MSEVRTIRRAPVIPPPRRSIIVPDYARRKMMAVFKTPLTLALPGNDWRTLDDKTCARLTKLLDLHTDAPEYDVEGTGMVVKFNWHIEKWQVK